MALCGARRSWLHIQAPIAPRRRMYVWISVPWRRVVAIVLNGLHTSTRTDEEGGGWWMVGGEDSDDAPHVEQIQRAPLRPNCTRRPECSGPRPSSYEAYTRRVSPWLRLQSSKQPAARTSQQPVATAAAGKRQARKQESRYSTHSSSSRRSWARILFQVKHTWYVSPLNVWDA